MIQKLCITSGSVLYTISLLLCKLIACFENGKWFYRLNTHKKISNALLTFQFIDFYRINYASKYIFIFIRVIFCNKLNAIEKKLLTLNLSFY